MNAPPAKGRSAKCQQETDEKQTFLLFEQMALAIHNTWRCARKYGSTTSRRAAAELNIT